MYSHRKKTHTSKQLRGHGALGIETCCAAPNTPTSLLSPHPRAASPCSGMGRSPTGVLEELLQDEALSHLQNYPTGVALSEFSFASIFVQGKQTNPPYFQLLLFASTCPSPPRQSRHTELQAHMARTSICTVAQALCQLGKELVGHVQAQDLEGI